MKYNDSVMKNFDPTKKLREEYDDKLTYNYWISASIAQGDNALVVQFLKKVPNTDKKGDLYFICQMIKNFLCF